jgi:hypothetical protein
MNNPLDREVLIAARKAARTEHRSGADAAAKRQHKKERSEKRQRNAERDAQRAEDEDRVETEAAEKLQTSWQKADDERRETERIRPSYKSVFSRLYKDPRLTNEEYLKHFPRSEWASLPFHRIDLTQSDDNKGGE